MDKDRLMGALILVVSILVIIIYGWLIFLSPWSSLIVEISLFIAVLAIFAILSWIGYTMLTTSPPTPIEPETEPSPEKTETKE